MSDGREDRAAVLRIEDLACAFGETAVLSDVSLGLAKGEMLAVLGPSGSGKSTLLRCIAGLHSPRSGQIELNGHRVQDGPKSLVAPEHRGVGFLFQDYALFPALTVRKNIAFGLGKDPSGRALDLLEKIGLSGLAERMPGELSGGQQQRVALARALAPRPKLLLLDEPFANVDAERRAGLAREIRRLLQEEGVGAIMVTHDREEAFAMADRIAACIPRKDQGGMLRQVATPQELYSRPSNADVGRLAGSISALPAMATGRTASCALGEIGLIEARKGRGQLLLRPEQLAFLPGDGEAVLVSAQFTGRCQRLRLRLSGGEELLAEAPNAISLREGQSGRLAVIGPAWMPPPTRASV